MCRLIIYNNKIEKKTSRAFILRNIRSKKKLKMKNESLKDLGDLITFIMQPTICMFVG